jgi:multicomponent Na+:H+ antiporter subunit F
MNNKTLRYIFSLLIIIGLAGLLLIFPFKILIYPQLPFLGLLKRALSILLLCAFFCLYRIFRGPHAADRVMALDMLGIIIMGVCAVLSISTQRSWYIDIAIAWGLQSFISTLAFSKFLEGKDFDE